MEDEPPSQIISARHHNTALQFLGLHTSTKVVGHNPKIGDARNPLFTVSITHCYSPVKQIKKKHVVENNRFSRTDIFSVA